MALGFKPLGSGPIGTAGLPRDPRDIGETRIACTLDIDISDELGSPDAMVVTMTMTTDAEISGQGETGHPTRWTQEQPVQGNWFIEPAVTTI